MAVGKSSSGAAGHGAAARAGTAGAPVLIDGDLDNTHSPFDGIRDEQPSGSKDLLILLPNVLGYLLQHLTHRRK